MGKVRIAEDFVTGPTASCGYSLSTGRQVNAKLRFARSSRRGSSIRTKRRPNDAIHRPTTRSPCNGAGYSRPATMPPVSGCLDSPDAFVGDRTTFANPSPTKLMAAINDPADASGGEGLRTTGRRDHLTAPYTPATPIGPNRSSASRSCCARNRSRSLGNATPPRIHTTRSCFARPISTIHPQHYGAFRNRDQPAYGCSTHDGNTVMTESELSTDALHGRPTRTLANLQIGLTPWTESKSLTGMA